MAATVAVGSGLLLNDWSCFTEPYLHHNVSLLLPFQGDFCNMPFPDESFSRVYAIEATCHASDDLSRVYADVYRILKPGGLFAFYEWIMTDKYDPENPYHQKIKNEILVRI